MILSVLRSTFCSDDLQIPVRPIIDSAQFEKSRKFSDGSISAVYKISLANVKADAMTGKVAGASVSTAGTWNSIENIVKLEVVGCVQKLNRPEITRWKQIAVVDVRKRKDGRMQEGASAIKNSIKIAGFNPGYRYQVAVRYVDSHERRGLFSKPIFLVPPSPPADTNIIKL